MYHPASESNIPSVLDKLFNPGKGLLTSVRKCAEWGMRKHRYYDIGRGWISKQDLVEAFQHENLSVPSWYCVNRSELSWGERSICCGGRHTWLEFPFNWSACFSWLANRMPFMTCWIGLSLAHGFYKPGECLGQGRWAHLLKGREKSGTAWYTTRTFQALRYGS